MAAVLENRCNVLSMCSDLCLMQLEFPDKEQEKRRPPESEGLHSLGLVIFRNKLTKRQYLALYRDYIQISICVHFDVSYNFLTRCLGSVFFTWDCRHISCKYTLLAFFKKHLSVYMSFEKPVLFNACTNILPI